MGALGILSSRRASLGATAAISADCWEAPGFKACHTKAWERAREACQPGIRVTETDDQKVAREFYSNNLFGSESDCIKYVDPVLTVRACASLCPKTKPVVQPPEVVVEPAPEPNTAGMGTKEWILIAGALALAWMVFREGKKS